MTPTPYAIFGGRGGGDVIADYLDLQPGTATVLGFLNDLSPPGSLVCGRTVLGGFTDWRGLPTEARFLAPLHKAKEIQARRAVVDGLGVPEDRWGRAIHPGAVISPRATLGAGACIGPLCDLSPGVVLGRHVALRAGASLGHDVVLGDFAFFGPKAVSLGYVEVGEGAHIGPGAILRESIRIGRYAVVGFGSAVVRDVEDFTIVAGNPARVIGRIEPRPGA
jgi:acetyltransferase EpsM